MPINPQKWYYSFEDTYKFKEVLKVVKIVC